MLKEYKLEMIRMTTQAEEGTKILKNLNDENQKIRSELRINDTLLKDSEARYLQMQL